jgi:uncharacterized membrane protein (DUF106 family)
MKTIKKVKNEVSVLKEEIEKARKFGTTREIQRLTKKLIHLNDCILYLESKPRIRITKIQGSIRNLDLSE